MLSCWALARLTRIVGAGAVVTKGVPDFALVAGVPAKRIRWVGRAGVPLEAGATEGLWVCPQTGEQYQEQDNTLVEVS